MNATQSDLIPGTPKGTKHHPNRRIVVRLDLEVIRKHVLNELFDDPVGEDLGGFRAVVHVRDSSKELSYRVLDRRIARMSAPLSSTPPCRLARCIW